MFDWDDEELTNMIWRDDGETDDHIVPSKVRGEQLNRKEASEESKTVNPAEQKIAGINVGLHDGKLGSSSGHSVNDGVPQPDFCMGSWIDSSLSNARKANPDLRAIELSKCLAEPARNDTTIGEETSELGKGPDIFHSTDESKEQGDFDDYSWANIGSFDDLDRMFSDVPIFGDGSFNAADGLWSPSKDVSNGPSEPLPSILDSQDLGLDINRAESEQLVDQPFPLIGKANDPSSPCVPNSRLTLKAKHYREQKAQPSDGDQPYRRSKILKVSKIFGTSEAGACQNLYGPCPPSRKSPGKFVNPLSPSQSSLMAGINLQSESQGSGTSHHRHMDNPYMTASGFGNLKHPYSTVPVLSTIKYSDAKNQLMHPSCNHATGMSVKMATDASARSSTMTPQEKLEKLRRRQQMQAMLAIQRQQQQFRHRVPVADQSITQNRCQDNPLQFVDKTNLQGLTAMPSFHPNSPPEVNDSGNFAAAAAADDVSAEFSALYRLQDIVAKLDMGIRTCIRDSLFRLAGSAAQRHHSSDTAHTNKSSQDEQEDIAKEESKRRYGEMPDTETVTNPTDRTVAHLLFHRPFEMSAKHVEVTESPASSKMVTEEKENFPQCSRHESYIKTQNPHEEGLAGTFPSTQQMETSPCIDALGNATNSGSSSAGVEASQGNTTKL